METIFKQFRRNLGCESENKARSLKKVADSLFIYLAYNSNGEVVAKETESLKGYQVQLTTGNKAIKK